MRLLRLYLIIFILTLLASIAKGQEPENYETTPCQSCHKDSEQEMAQSVHGMKFLLSQGVSSQEAEKITACLTCHSKHGKDDPEASNFPIKEGRDVELCGSCHSPEQAFYFESYHGRHLALKKSNTPTCTYCHVGHERPISDTQSFLQSSNVGKICAGCHAGSDQGKLVMAANLATPSTGATLYGRDVYKLSFIIEAFYSFLGLIFLAFATTCGRELVSSKGSSTASRQATEDSFKVQMLLFVVLYLLLDLSGTSLLYAYDYGSPVSFFMSKISALLMNVFGSDDARSLVHRLAAISLSLLFLFHLGYLFKKREFRQKIRLKAVDLKMAWQEIRFKVQTYSPENYLWKRKLAYWSVLFLLLMMILTGWLQWLAFSILKFSQLQVIRYARLVHDWSGLLLSMTLYGIIILYFGILHPLMKRRR